MAKQEYCNDCPFVDPLYMFGSKHKMLEAAFCIHPNVGVTFIGAANGCHSLEITGDDILTPDNCPDRKEPTDLSY